MRKVLALVVFFLFIATPGSAGTVRIVGSGILFIAGSGETNSVEVNGQFNDDPILGEGFLISDTNTIVTSGDGCRALETRVICTINPTFVKLELRDGNDTALSIAGVRMIVNGGPGDDVITGNSENDDLDGDLGNDTIDGGRGDDVIRGGLGDDILTGGLGNDRMIGGTGNDTLDGGPGADDLDSGTGVDRLIGGTGLDKFSAGAGKDTIDAQDGVAETIRCGGGKDTVTRDANDDPRRCND